MGGPLAQQRGLAEARRGGDQRQLARHTLIQSFGQAWARDQFRADAGNVEFGGQQWHGHFAFPGSTWRPTSLVNQESWMPLFYHILSIPAKLLACLNAYPPSASGIWGGCIGQVSNPPNSIGTALQPQVVIQRTNGKC